MRLGISHYLLAVVSGAMAMLMACSSHPTTPAPPDRLADDATDHQTWHDHYQRGWTAIKRQDFLSAEQHLLACLAAAEHFDSCDRRLAETLDDLGLVYFSLNNDYQAELMQGRAVSELLLAKGFGDPDLPVFATRLGYIFNRQNRRHDLSPLDRQPYRIFDLGYLLEDERLAKRINALIYEYERAGDQEAVDYLSHFTTTIRQGQSTGSNGQTVQPRKPAMTSPRSVSATTEPARDSNGREAAKHPATVPQ